MHDTQPGVVCVKSLSPLWRTPLQRINRYRTMFTNEPCDIESSVLDADVLLRSIDYTIDISKMVDLKKFEATTNKKTFNNYIIYLICYLYFGQDLVGVNKCQTEIFLSNSSSQFLMHLNPDITHHRNTSHQHLDCRISLTTTFIPHSPTPGYLSLIF